MGFAETAAVRPLMTPPLGPGPTGGFCIHGVQPRSGATTTCSSSTSPLAARSAPWPVTPSAAGSTPGPEPVSPGAPSPSTPSAPSWSASPSITSTRPAPPRSCGPSSRRGSSAPSPPSHVHLRGHRAAPARRLGACRGVHAREPAGRSPVRWRRTLARRAGVAVGRI